MIITDTFTYYTLFPLLTGNAVSSMVNKVLSNSMLGSSDILLKEPSESIPLCDWTSDKSVVCDPPTCSIVSFSRLTGIAPTAVAATCATNLPFTSGFSYKCIFRCICHFFCIYHSIFNVIMFLMEFKKMYCYVNLQSPIKQLLTEQLDLCSLSPLLFEIANLVLQYSHLSFCSPVSLSYSLKHFFSCDWRLARLPHFREQFLHGNPSPCYI